MRASNQEVHSYFKGYGERVAGRGLRSMKHTCAYLSHQLNEPWQNQSHTFCPQSKEVGETFSEETEDSR